MSGSKITFKNTAAGILLGLIIICLWWNYNFLSESIESMGIETKKISQIKEAAKQTFQDPPVKSEKKGNKGMESGSIQNSENERLSGSEKSGRNAAEQAVPDIVDVPDAAENRNNNGKMQTEENLSENLMENLSFSLDGSDSKSAEIEFSKEEKELNQSFAEKHRFEFMTFDSKNSAAIMRDHILEVSGVMLTIEQDEYGYVLYVPYEDEAQKTETLAKIEEFAGLVPRQL